MPKILLLEFNEICPWLLKRWIGQGELPNFSALYQSSQVFTISPMWLSPDYLETLDPMVLDPSRTALWWT